MGSCDPYPIADVFRGGAWRAATFCGPNGGNCVQVNLGTPGLAALRDSKVTAGPVLVIDHEKWAAFRDAAKSGQFGHV
jgi:hypothetical protein